MIFQNDKMSPAQFRAGGCNYFCFLEMLFRLFPELGQLNMLKAIIIYEKQLADGEKDIRPDMLMEDPQNIIDDLLGKGRMEFCKYNGSVNFPVGYKPGPWEYVIDYWQYFENGVMKGTHFTLPGFQFGPSWPKDYDPWFPASPWRLKGKLAGHRVYRLINKG